MDFKNTLSLKGTSVSVDGHAHTFDTFPVLACKAYKTETQTYTLNITTKVKIDNMLFNTGLNVDMANERLVFPNNISGQGIFEIRANIDLSGTSNMYIYVYKNGTLLETPYYCSTALNTHMCTTMLQFAPNDYIEIWIRGGTSRTIKTTSTLSIKQVA